MTAIAYAVMKLLTSCIQQVRTPDCFYKKKKTCQQFLNSLMHKRVNAILQCPIKSYGDLSEASKRSSLNFASNINRINNLNNFYSPRRRQKTVEIRIVR